MKTLGRKSAKNCPSGFSKFLERHEGKVAIIQESKLSSSSKHPELVITVKRDCCQCQGGGLHTLIHNYINLSWRPESHETLAELHLDELCVRVCLG